MESQAKTPTVILVERIKQLMGEKKLKSIDVSAEARMETSNFRKYITGKKEMKLTTLLRIAAALDVTPSELLQGVELKK